MEELKYIIEDKTIAEILGVQNFSTKEAAILELVKNAYDAGASSFSIVFEEDKITVSDNGCGMNQVDIKKNWMHIGYSDKEYEFKDINNNIRVSAGSKGIGRFALSRLGEKIRLYSRKKEDQGILWSTDWNKNTLVQNNEIKEGTRIIIEKLRDKWTNKSIEILDNFLSRTCNCKTMTISITFDGETKVVQSYFADVKLGINCLSYIDLKYNAEEKRLYYSIYSDEFTQEAEKYCPDIDIYHKDGYVDILDTLNLNNFEIDKNEISNYLVELGDFSAKIIYSLKTSSTDDVQKFLYKYKILPDRFTEGVILYRNAFSIATYEGKRDWLELGKRARKSPAAASHPSGAWRVRDNQIAGFVNIDKKQNHELKDLSNRQGLEENSYYKLFINLIQIGIAEFESYRQAIIRKINAKNVEEIIDTSFIDQVLKDPNRVSNLQGGDLAKFVKEVGTLKRKHYEEKQNTKIVETRYKYDVRILNMLSTIGLRASSIAHEMQNDRNDIYFTCDYMIDAMKELGIWDIVSAEKNTQYAYKNIPELINTNKKINVKIIRFMDTMLSDIEKSQFEIKSLDVLNVIRVVKDVWERDYAWIKINVPEGNIILKTAEDVIKVLLDNLILNSIQQNEKRSSLFIDISVKKNQDGIIITYKDNGVGLDKKYINDPRKILEVHESSRENGHGLGMWIINNTLIMSGGEVIDIPVTKGFEIKMLLGEKL